MNSLIIILALAIIFLVSRRINKNNKQKKQAPDDPYNDFHLGEMTSHDVPTMKENTRWSGRQIKKAEDVERLKREETQNGKAKVN